MQPRTASQSLIACGADSLCCAENLQTLKKKPLQIVRMGAIGSAEGHLESSRPAMAARTLSAVAPRPRRKDAVTSPSRATASNMSLWRAVRRGFGKSLATDDPPSALLLLRRRSHVTHRISFVEVRFCSHKRIVQNLQPVEHLKKPERAAAQRYEHF